MRDNLEGTYTVVYSICKATTFEVQVWRVDDFQDVAPYARHFFQYLEDPNPSSLSLLPPLKYPWSGNSTIINGYPEYVDNDMGYSVSSQNVRMAFPNKPWFKEYEATVEVTYH